MRRRVRAKARYGLACLLVGLLTDALGTLLATTSHLAAAEPVVVADGIPASLTGSPGDPIRGRTIVADRQKGLCLMCHAGPLPEARGQGTLAPDLAGAGARWSEAQLRLRIVDSRRLNPVTVMPSYAKSDGLVRVAPAFAGKPLLTAAEIEDVVAFLVTLR